MAKRLPFMPLSTDAFLADTAGMSAIEVGAYTLLLVAMWRADGFLPNDDRRLARMAHVNAAQWKRIKPTLMRIFQIERDLLTSRALVENLGSVRKKSINASHSAKAKWLKRQDTVDAVAMRTQSDRSANYKKNRYIPYDIGGEADREQPEADPKQNGLAEGDGAPDALPVSAELRRLVSGGRA